MFVLRERCESYRTRCHKDCCTLFRYGLPWSVPPEQIDPLLIAGSHKSAEWARKGSNVVTSAAFVNCFGHDAGLLPSLGDALPAKQREKMLVDMKKGSKINSDHGKSMITKNMGTFELTNRKTIDQIGRKLTTRPPK